MITIVGYDKYGKEISICDICRYSDYDENYSDNRFDHKPCDTCIKLVDGELESVNYCPIVQL